MDEKNKILHNKFGREDLKKQFAVALTKLSVMAYLTTKEYLKTEIS